MGVYRASLSRTRWSREGGRYVVLTLYLFPQYVIKLSPLNLNFNTTALVKLTIMGTHGRPLNPADVFRQMGFGSDVKYVYNEAKYVIFTVLACRIHM